MAKKIVFTIVALAIFATHIILSSTEIFEPAKLTNGILLAILIVAIGILFSIKD